MHNHGMTTERPVNSAAISPLYDHVVLGGGQEAMEVTTTSSKAGKFDARLCFHVLIVKRLTFCNFIQPGLSTLN